MLQVYCCVESPEPFHIRTPSFDHVPLLGVPGKQWRSQKLELLTRLLAPTFQRPDLRQKSTLTVIL